MTANNKILILKVSNVHICKQKSGAIKFYLLAVIKY